MTDYEQHLSLQEARGRYFDANGFGPEGGYNDKWVDFKLGPIPFPFPNTAGRVRAVKFHDLHHIVTGYRTDVRGEFEISAWEIGSGCADMLAAWQLNLGGMGLGALVAPRRVWRAFLRGRRSQNLYRHHFDQALLTRSVAATKRELGLESPSSPGPARPRDVFLFGLAVVVGVSAAVVGFLIFAPVALLAAGPLQIVARRNRDAQQGGARQRT